jgi:hypothetical protein
VSKNNEKSEAENVGQMLERVMTVAELLAKRSADKSADKHPENDEKTQEQQYAIK